MILSAFLILLFIQPAQAEDSHPCIQAYQDRRDFYERRSSALGSLDELYDYDDMKSFFGGSDLNAGISMAVLIPGYPLAALTAVITDLSTSGNVTYIERMTDFLTTQKIDLREEVIRKYMWNAVQAHYEIEKGDFYTLVKSLAPSYFCDYRSEPYLTEKGRQAMGGDGMMALAHKRSRGDNEDWDNFWHNADHFTTRYGAHPLARQELREKLYELLDSKGIERKDFPEKLTPFGSRR